MAVDQPVDEIGAAEAASNAVSRSQVFNPEDREVQANFSQRFAFSFPIV